MALFGKKKSKKKSKAKVTTQVPKPAAGPTEEEIVSKLPEKPDWLRSSNVGLREVETAIDLKADGQSRSNILKMYEDKYGEKLEAPEFSAGLKYEYQLYEEADIITKREVVGVEEGEEKGAIGTKGTKKEEPKKEKKGLFSRKPKAETAGGEKEGEEEESAPEVPAAPGFFDPRKEVDWVKGAKMCIGLGKPLFPITGFVRYKARERKGWMWALVLVDLAILPIPLSIIFWRAWARIGYELYVRTKRKKEFAAMKEVEGEEPAENDTKKAANA
jgi:hypothetical protein